jgi:hypothetical protein
MKSYIQIKKLLIILGIVAFFTGCMGIGPKTSSNAHKATLAGDYKKAALESDKEKDFECDLDEANQLQTLYAGNSYFYLNDYKTSIKRFNEAENIIKYHKEEILLGKTGDLIAQLMISDAVIDYHATITDGIMVNTYKAINYMALGQMDEARVEFNRAIDRQRRAKEIYSKLINKQKNAIIEKNAIEQKRIAAEKKRQQTQTRGRQPQNLSLDIGKTLNNPDIDKMLERRYPTLNQFEAYPDFINPFTNYLAGIFFATQKDYTKSIDILKEVYGMSPNNQAIKQDLVMVENILNGKKIKINNVWIIYSNGLAPKKEQFKINVPLFLFTNRLHYTGIALPKMVKQKLATPHLSVFNQNKLISTSKSFADMDRVILTEFRYSYSDIVSRAVFSALMKTYFQYQVQKNLGDWASLAVSIFQAISTQADTRTWGNLPKEYQISRVAMPKDHNLKIQIATQMIDINLKNMQNAIIFVRKPSIASKVSYSVIKL